jgi:hypothetical protein
MKKSFFKSLFTLMLSGLLMGLVFTACDKEEDEDFLGSVSVQLVLKEGLGDISLTNINVSLISIADNVERKALADEAGLAEFSEIPAGNYNINVSESRNEGEYTLTGTASNIVVEMRENTLVNLTIDAINPNADLVIKEVYFPGAADSYVSLFKDQFIEIFNNSSEVIYADGLYVACMFNSRPTNSAIPYSQVLDLNEYLYAELADQVPGNGTDYPIEPGKSIVIAFNAINFKEGNPQPDRAVDNSTADLERYSVEWLQAQGRTGSTFFDMNNPDVPNMNNIFLSSNHVMYLMEVSGPSVVIFRKETAFTEADVFQYDYNNQGGNPRTVNLLKIPTSLVIDGLDVVENAEEGGWKRLPESIDSGFTYLKADGGAFYSGMSLRRKIDQEASLRFGRPVLQTTKNSFTDFESINFPDARGYDNVTF